MKKHLFNSTLLFLWLIIVPVVSFAQQKLEPLSIDSKVRYGKLDNGLTYFIRHNEKPKQNASFYIAQAVGSVLETDAQSGLAHFLEHMAFNGTKNFPEKTMINYLETIGVKFGENLNAYTGFDETVYNISNVPVIREGIVDSCLLVLHDWSGFISLKEKAIDAERKIIHEEWRTRNDANNRITSKMLKENYPGSQYANRLPIGSMDVVDNFKYQEIRDYYHKWYRPDLQAIIIVGDIDVDQIEAKIKKIFADIPKPVNPAPRIYYPVPDNKEPIISILTDNEASASDVTICFKHEPISLELSRTILDVQQDYVRKIYSIMTRGRFGEIAQQANPPFLRAFTYDGTFIASQTMDALSFKATCKEGTTKTAFVGLLTEVERLKQYGFTESEYERARTSFLKIYENAYKERDNVESDNYCKSYAHYFTQGGTLLSIEDEYAAVQKLANATPVSYINEYFKGLIGKENVVINITGPEKENVSYPSKAEVLDLFNKISEQKLEPYKDNVINEPLISKMPVAGKITKESKNEKLGTTELYFSNGTKVVLKPTTFKDNEILMSFSRSGGVSQLPQKEYASLKLINDLASIGGWGNFDAISLKKALTGKSASVNTSISVIEEGGSGNSTISDFETMLQLLYLNFTAPRIDSTAYASFINRKKATLQSAEGNPFTVFGDSLNQALYKSNPFFKRLESSDLANVNYPKAIEMYKSRFGNAAGFTFFLVGNIDIEQMKPLIAKYIGGLAGTTYKEPKMTVDLSIRKENYSNVFEKELKTTKATIIDNYVTQLDYTPENIIKLNILSQILDIVYTEKVRMKEGGTYGVNVSNTISKYPKGESLIRMFFETSPDKSEYLNNIIHKEFKAFAEGTPRIEDFNKVKEFIVKKRKDDLHENSFWRSSLANIYLQNLNMIDSFDEIMNKLKPEDISAFAKEFVTKGRCIEVIMNGYEKK